MAPIQMLWIGPRLSALERLSMASFLAHGHEVRLYTYGDVEGIPPGVTHHDGREIVPASQVFTYASGFGKGSYAGFANLFRYKLLLDHGGIWCDSDVVCLRPFDFTDEYVIGRERLPPHVASGDDTTRLATCVLKTPPNSRVMLECYAVCMEVNKTELPMERDRSRAREPAFRAAPSRPLRAAAFGVLPDRLVECAEARIRAVARAPGVVRDPFLERGVAFPGPGQGRDLCARQHLRDPEAPLRRERLSVGAQPQRI